MLQQFLTRLFALGPIWFGLLFLPPVIAQALSAIGVESIGGTSPLIAGFGLGGIWGLFAWRTGKWLPGL
ncbi:MAG: hypothetical protein WA906_01960 [Pacificimonas sp.]